MNTLDWGEVTERDPHWFEEYDLSCPYCEGSGERTVYIRGAVRSYEEFEGYYDTEEEYCEECQEGQFEVMWNTAFEVDVCSSFDEEEARLIAWENGFCLITHGQSQYLLMGCCGLDNTLCIQYTRWKLQGGYLEEEDKQRCLSSGGWVFLEKKKRRKLYQYLLDAGRTPAQYAEDYKRDTAKIKRRRRGIH